MARTLGQPRIHLRETDSTNARARRLAHDGAPHGTLVTASAQQAGRGRQGRTWSAPPGSSLLLSLVLRDPPPLLPLAAAVAVAETAGDAARIKWPNDVLLDRRKVAGILAEGRPAEGWAVLGIGLNVAVDVTDLPPELHDRAGTLGRPRDALEPTLATLLGALERWLPATPDVLLAAYRERDALAGEPIAWGGHRGVAQGVDEDGRLLVAVDDGTLHALDAGEVHLLAGPGTGAQAPH